MSTKSYGGGVSGYLDPEGRGWETAVFQSSKPVLDKELNLVQDAEQENERRFRKRTFPSGWLSDDFLATSSSTSAIFTASAVANELAIPQDLRAHVNGWLVRVGHTNANGSNKLSLGAGPSGAGAKRTDLVILEVWRRLIPASSATGKSSAGRIWWFGNVKVAGADDLTLNFADDILDGAVGAETTRRVQIQYRLRVVQGVDVFGYPYGIDDPVVFANSVPASAGAPDGVATAFSFTNQSSDGDPGLWRAGDGNPANAIGSVDGYIYAVPLCAVFRRNTTAFARNTNHNGGVASPGPSDRPDGLFHDIIAARDIADLRFGVSPSGWDYTEVLEKNLNFLFDNVTRTEVTSTVLGGGVHGNTYLWADEIGISNANGGDGVTTGDTPGAEFVGEFDAARRRFSDRSIIETVTVAYTPADGSGGGPNWAGGDTITISPTALPIYPYAAFNWASFAPSNVSIVDLVDGHYIGSGGAQISSRINENNGVYDLAGLGAVPVGPLTLTIAAPPTGITNETLYLRLQIAYPAGVGLSKTPVADYGSASLSVNNPGQLPAGAPILFEAIDGFGLNYANREAAITYRTVSRTITVSAPATALDPRPIPLPERAQSISDVTINGFGPYGGPKIISDDGFTLTLGAGAVSASADIGITFKAIRPLPQNDEQVTVYYDARAPQTARESSLSTSITVIPRYISPHLYTMTVGSGSQDEAFPFPQQYVQVGAVYPTSGGSYGGDHLLAGTNTVTVADFNANTGLLRLHSMMPMVPNPEALTFNRDPGDADIEGRTYFKSVPGGYIPSSAAQPLSDARRHKNVQPILAELTSDGTLGRKGQIVLILISRYAEMDASNMVAFRTSLAANTTCASVYRVKGNLLNYRRV